MEVQNCDSQQLLSLKFKLFRRLVMRGSNKSYLWRLISELHKLIVDIQTTLAKLSSQDGNSREHRIKVPNRLLSEIKDVTYVGYS